MQHLLAAEPRQHEIEHDEMIGLGAQELVGLLAVTDRVDRIAELAQPTDDHVGEILRVLDDQDAHCRASPDLATRALARRA